MRNAFQSHFTTILHVVPIRISPNSSGNELSIINVTKPINQQ
jgi:hypothetical protein